MKVGDIMTRDVRYCRWDDPLNEAARLMWENDCGSLPVICDDGRLMGMITDRDICMAAYTKGKPLTEMHVTTAMSLKLCFCSPDDSTAAAQAKMREYQIRRLPVVDEEQRLVGILSLNDLALQAKQAKKKSGLSTAQVGETLADICARAPRAATAG